jgi:hypothetical protein
MPASDSTRSHWQCPCGARLESEQALLDHQEWCTGDGPTNARLIERVARLDGEATHEGLVAAARQHGLAAEAARPDHD